MVERIQVDAAQRNPGGIDGEQFAPKFFFGRMQADNDDGVGIHDFSAD
jgi:hypothetical protein